MASARRAAKKYLYRNVTSGYITPDEHYLSRSGLRGKKAALCCACAVLVACLAVAHLLVTCFILGVLVFTSSGPRDFQAGETLVVRREAFISQTRLAGAVSSYAGQPLQLSSSQLAAVRLEAASRGSVVLNGSRLQVSSSLLRAGPLQGSSSQVTLTNLEHISSMEATSLNAAEITSSQGLQVSGHTVHSTAATRVQVGGREVAIASGQVVNLTASELLVGGAVRVGGQPAMAGGCYHVCACDNGTVFLLPCNPLRCAAPTLSCS